MAVRLSALRAGRPLQQEDSWSSFLSELSRPHGHGAAGRIRSVGYYPPVYTYVSSVASPFMFSE
jgi:hypothetical protein